MNKILILGTFIARLKMHGIIYALKWGLITSPTPPELLGGKIVVNHIKLVGTWILLWKSVVIFIMLKHLIVSFYNVFTECVIECCFNFNLKFSYRKMIFRSGKFNNLVFLSIMRWLVILTNFLWQKMFIMSKSFSLSKLLYRVRSTRDQHAFCKGTKWSNLLMKQSQKISPKEWQVTKNLLG